MKAKILSVLALLFLAASCEKITDETFAPFVAGDEGKVLNWTANDYVYASAIKGDTVFVVNGVSFKMIRVEGGTFNMGNANGEQCSPVPSRKTKIQKGHKGKTHEKHPTLHLSVWILCEPGADGPMTNYCAV
jgi:hypothetical protein